MSGDEKRGISFRWALGVLTLALLMVQPLATWADPDTGDLPCGGADPYNQCPLDAGTLVLLIAALFLGIWHIAKQRKAVEGR